MGAVLTIIIAAIAAVAAVASAIISAYAARQSRLASEESNKASQEAARTSAAMAELEADRRRDERTPRFTAELTGRPQNSRLVGFKYDLVVWLETTEPVCALQVVVQEAVNLACPVGFQPGQPGVVDREPEWYALKSFQPGWQSDSLRPDAMCLDALAPGTAAVWEMGLRDTVTLSAGPAGIRFTARARALRDDQEWQVPLPVTVTDNTADEIYYVKRDGI